LNLFFKRHGFEVTGDPGGSQVYKGNHPVPDIYLIDYNLGVNHGGTICSRIKQITAQVSVLLRSADPSVRTIALACNADGFIDKSFSVHCMLGLIEMLIANTSMLSPT
jgi:DNA-binding NarL/FixJ family response regulator